MERNIANGTAGHLNVANISDHRISLGCILGRANTLLIEEGFKDDDLISWFNEPHESTQHTLDC